MAPTPAPCTGASVQRSCLPARGNVSKPGAAQPHPAWTFRSSVFMKSRSFRYIRPASLAHAYQILTEADGDAVPIAGGQSLLAGLNMRLSAPKLLVDIGDIRE